MTEKLQQLPLYHESHPQPAIKHCKDFFQISFQAMASDCELLIDLPEERIGFAKHLADSAVREVWRIERKYSRYLAENTFTRIHEQSGHWQEIDDETYRLLEFADQGWQISDGLFDLTSGVLRKVWSFNGSDQLPEQADIQVLLSDIGWSKLDYRKVGDKAELLLPEGMELDFGGIGKEYAVDRALGLMLAEAEADETSLSVLVNLGGDMACSGLRLNGETWKVAIERPDTDESSLALLSLAGGGLATSGDSRRYLLKEGVRYSHVLNPKTGWPVESAPRSITVAAPSCVQSGLIATLALLQGDNAENFLRATGLRYWLVSA